MKTSYRTNVWQACAGDPRYARDAHLKVTLGAHAPGMHNTLWDLLPIELSEFLKKVVVLQEHRTCPAHILVSVKV